MKRREFITLLAGAGAWPVVARAQSSGKIVRIGILTTANPRSASFIRSFEQKLRELGDIEGQNMVIDFRNAEGQVDRLPDLATDLVRLGADVIVTATDPATHAAKKATTAIPILMVAINFDPIALSYVDGPARMSQGYSFSILNWWPKGMGYSRKCCHLCAEWRSYPTD